MLPTLDACTSSGISLVHMYCILGLCYVYICVQEWQIHLCQCACHIDACSLPKIMQPWSRRVLAHGPLQVRLKDQLLGFGCCCARMLRPWTCRTLASKPQQDFQAVKLCCCYEYALRPSIWRALVPELLQDVQAAICCCCCRHQKRTMDINRHAPEPMQDHKPSSMSKCPLQ